MRMFTLKTFLITFLLLLLEQRGIFALQDVTVELFGTNKYGTVAAFGDFNSDKQTDIFVIRERIIGFKVFQIHYAVNILNTNCRNILMSLMGFSFPQFQWRHDSRCLRSDHASPNCSLLSYQKVKVISFKNAHFLALSLTATLSFIQNNIESCFPHHFRIQECRNDFNKSIRMRTPHSNAFIDLDKDFTAGDCGKAKSHVSLQFNPVFLFPDLTLCFILADGDGYQDHLLPACLDEACQKSVIYIAKRSTEEWVEVLSDFKQRDTVWGFVPGDAIHPLVLHLGDYNLDGFPDALVILRNTSGRSEEKTYQPILAEHRPGNDILYTSIRNMLNVIWEGYQNINILIKMFNVADFKSGILDMLILSEAEGKSDLMIHALKNNFEADAYFVKVMVLSGLCSNACPDDVKPFGVNQPGPYVMYTTADSNGYLKNASAGQLSQSAHFSLQLPYTVLGLGRSANFLDHLFVGIPRRSGETETRKHEWTAIIPNSQLIVIPFPHNTPRRWSAKLYLTPSNSVLLTAIALIGVCVFILVIIGILHWKEKKADDREKRQEAHRFHFDAM
uniref:Integrin alpha FG-GAP repeat containing 1 n=1 Tax=Xiphophorus couchianus TaxID=32473 RepID=A0A3B5MRZ0_9TELE